MHDAPDEAFGLVSVSRRGYRRKQEQECGDFGDMRHSVPFSTALAAAGSGDSPLRAGALPQNATREALNSQRAGSRSPDSSSNEDAALHRTGWSHTGR